MSKDVTGISGGTVAAAGKLLSLVRPVVDETESLARSHALA